MESSQHHLLISSSSKPCKLDNMRVFYAIGLLLLINGQVNSLPTTLGEEDVDTEFEEWLTNKVDDLTGLEPYHQEIQRLQILKNAGVGDFLKCERLTEGIQNIGQMLKDTYNITVDVGSLVKNVAAGLAMCAAGSPFLAPFCVGKYIYEFSAEIQSFIPAYELYKLDVTRLASEIKEIYNYCSTARN